MQVIYEYVQFSVKHLTDFDLSVYQKQFPYRIKYYLFITKAIKPVKDLFGEGHIIVGGKYKKMYVTKSYETQAYFYTHHSMLKPTRFFAGSSLIYYSRKHFVKLFGGYGTGWNLRFKKKFPGIVAASLQSRCV